LRAEAGEGKGDPITLSLLKGAFDLYLADPMKKKRAVEVRRRKKTPRRERAEGVAAAESQGKKNPTAAKKEKAIVKLYVTEHGKKPSLALPTGRFRVENGKVAKGKKKGGGEHSCKEEKGKVDQLLPKRPSWYPYVRRKDENRPREGFGPVFRKVKALSPLIAGMKGGAGQAGPGKNQLIRKIHSGNYNLLLYGRRAEAEKKRGERNLSRLGRKGKEGRRGYPLERSKARILRLPRGFPVSPASKKRPR